MRLSSGILLVAVDPSGNAIIIWKDDRATPTSLYAQKLDPNGNRLWATDVQVNSAAASVGTTFCTAVAVDKAGNAIVVWDGVYAQKLRPQRKNRQWRTDVQVTAWGQTATVALDNVGGNAVVAFASSNGIRAQKLNGNGDRVWAVDTPVERWGKCRRQWPGDVSSEGQAFVAWSNNGIWIQKLGYDGTTLWSRDVQVNSTSGRWPAVTADGNGSAIVVYMVKNAFGYWGDVYAQKLDADGSRVWAADTRVNSETEYW